MRITVLGAGGWGTALAKLLSEAEHEVTLWGHNSLHLEELRRTGMNQRYLPGVRLPESWHLEPEIQTAVQTAECVVVAVPSKAFRQVTAHLQTFQGVAISVTKGIEYADGLTMSGILRETAPRASIAALSGPNLALEVARGMPTATVVASENESVAQTVQALFHRPAFRVYTSSDVLGVELGGALKNVIAIAAGTADGLGFGDNSKAALITRGIVEMRRLGVACGASPETFAGLSGSWRPRRICVFPPKAPKSEPGRTLRPWGTATTSLPRPRRLPRAAPTARSAILSLATGRGTPSWERFSAYK